MSDDFMDLSDIQPINKSAAIDLSDIKPISGQSGQGNKGIINDTLVGLGKGVMQIPGAITGLADIQPSLLGINRPFDRATDAIGNATGFKPSQWAKDADNAYSPAMQQARQNVNQVWDDPNTNALDVAKAYATNPRAIMGTVVESLPSMYAGGALGRTATGLNALAKTGTAAEVAKRAALAGNVGEGAIMAGQSMANIDESVDPQIAALAAAGTGFSGALIGNQSNRLANKFGLADIDTIAAGGVSAGMGDVNQSLARRVIGGAIQEGPIEEGLQSIAETGLQNLAEDKPVTQGMGRNFVEGSLAGSLMGGGVNAVSGPLSKAAAKAPVIQTPTTDDIGENDVSIREREIRTNEAGRGANDVKQTESGYTDNADESLSAPGQSYQQATGEGGLDGLINATGNTIPTGQEEGNRSETGVGGGREGSGRVSGDAGPGAAASEVELTPRELFNQRLTEKRKAEAGKGVTHDESIHAAIVSQILHGNSTYNEALKHQTPSSTKTTQPNTNDHVTTDIPDTGQPNATGLAASDAIRPADYRGATEYDNADGVSATGEAGTAFTHQLNDGYDTPVMQQDDGSYVDAEGYSYSANEDATPITQDIKNDTPQSQIPKNASEQVQIPANSLPNPALASGAEPAAQVQDNKGQQNKGQLKPDSDNANVATLSNQNQPFKTETSAKANVQENKTQQKTKTANGEAAQSQNAMQRTNTSSRLLGGLGESVEGELDPILSTPKVKYITNQKREYVKANPDVPVATKTAALKNISDNYDSDLDKALASAQFEVYAKHSTNQGQPESVLRQAHEALRQEHGITSDTTDQTQAPKASTVLPNRRANTGRDETPATGGDAESNVSGGEVKDVNKNEVQSNISQKNYKDSGIREGGESRKQKVEASASMDKTDASILDYWEGNNSTMSSNEYQEQNSKAMLSDVQKKEWKILHDKKDEISTAIAKEIARVDKLQDLTRSRGGKPKASPNRQKVAEKFGIAHKGWEPFDMAFGHGVIASINEAMKLDGSRATEAQIKQSVSDYIDENSPYAKSEPSQPSPAKVTGEKQGEGVKFSKSKPTTGSTVDDIKKLLPKRMNKLVDAGILNVVQSVDELPAHLQERGSALASRIKPTKYTQAKIASLIDGFIKEIGSTSSLSKEQKGIYDVITDTKIRSEIRKSDLEHVKEFVNLSQGHERFGKTHILLDHFSGKKGYITANEILDLGKVVRDGKLDIAGQKHIYTLNSGGVRFKVVVSAKGNKESIITFYSNRKTTNGIAAGHNALLDTKSKATPLASAINIDFNSGEIKKSSNMSGVEALYDEKRDQLYLVSDMLNKNNLSSVLSHELMHRAESKDVLVKAAIDRFEAQLQRSFDRADKGIGSAIELAAYKRVMAAETPVKDQASEYRAYMVSQWEAKPDSFTGLLKKTFADLVATIRAFLVRNGIDLGYIESLTPADLTALSKYGAAVNGTGTGSGILKSFAGQNAKTADTYQLSSAQQRIEAGDNPETVRQETGWFKGVDGKWRFEIDDSDAFFKGTGNFHELVMKRFVALNKGAGAISIGDILFHPALFSAYPQVADIEVRFMPEGESAKGRMVNSDGDYRIEIRGNLSSKEALSTLLHEIQHAIQSVEGFATGGNSNQFKDKDITDELRRPLDKKILGLMDANPEFGNLVRKKNRDFIKIKDTYGKDTPRGRALNWDDVPNDQTESYFDLLDKLSEFPENQEYIDLEQERRNILSRENTLTANEQYKRLAGEVEARNTQARQKLTAEQRKATPPSATADIQDSDVIVLFNGKEMNHIPAPRNADKWQGNAYDYETLGGDKTGLSKDAKNKNRPKTERWYGNAYDYEAKGGDKTGVKYSKADQERLAPNGKPSNLNAKQYEQVRTPEFKAWFGDWENDPENASKVVDSNGEPMVVYHGTDKEFTEFDVKAAFRENRLFFTNDRSLADIYGNKLLEVFISANSIKNTKESSVFIDALNDNNISEKYDGIEYNDVSELGNDIHQIVVFNPNQIKSATGNNGQFNPESSDIRYSKSMADLASDAINAVTPEEAKQHIETAFSRTASGAKAQSFGLLTLRQIADVTSKALPNIQKVFIKNIHAMDTEKNKRLSAAGEIATEWAKLPEAISNEMSDLMHDSTIAGVDGSKSYVPVIDIPTALAKIQILNKRMIGMPGEPKEKMMQERKELYMMIGFEKKRKLAYPEIKDRFNALAKKSPEAVKIYNDSRDHHEQHFNDTLEALKERIGESKASPEVKKNLIAQLRLKFESLQAQAPYFPLARFGDYWVHSQEGDETRFNMFESEKEQEDFIKQIGKEGVTVLGHGKQLENLSEIDGVSAEFITEVDSLISSLGDTPMVNDLRDSVYQLYLNSLPDVSARKHFIHRKKTKGFHQDQLRAFAKKALHDANSLAKLKYGYKLQATLDESKEAIDIASSTVKRDKTTLLLAWIDEYLNADLSLADISNRIGKTTDEDELAMLIQFKKWKNGYSKAALDDLYRHTENVLALSENIQRDDRTFAVNALDELRKSYKDIMNPKTNPLAQRLNSIGFAWYLGLTPAASLINITQTPVIALPILASKVGWGNASKAMLDVSKLFFKNAKLGKNGKLPWVEGLSIKDKLQGNELKAYDSWVESGLLDVTLAHDLAGLSDEGILTNTGKHKLMNVLSFGFHHAERMNREITALAAYRSAIGKGMSHNESVEFASKLVLDSHFDYTSSNRARFMRGNVARVVTQFKQYSQNLTYLYARTIQQAYGNSSPEEKAEAKKALKGLLIMQSSIAGTLGLPMVGVMTGMAQALSDAFGDDDEPEDIEGSYRQILADLVAEITGSTEAGNKFSLIMSKGLIDGLTPFSVSGRLSASDLWVRSSDQELEGTDRAWDWAKTLLGPMAGLLLENPAVAMGMMADGHYERGIEHMMPKAVKDAMKAMRFSTEGVENLRGDSIKDDYSIIEGVGQILGFSSSEISDIYDQNNAIKRIQTKMSDRRQLLLNEAAQAKMEGDSEGYQSAMEDIKAFNDKNPNHKITGTNILQSIQGRKRRSKDTENGLYVSKRNRDIAEKYQFAK